MGAGLNVPKCFLVSGLTHYSSFPPPIPPSDQLNDDGRGKKGETVQGNHSGYCPDHHVPASKPLTCRTESALEKVGLPRCAGEAGALDSRNRRTQFTRQMRQAFEYPFHHDHHL